MPPHRLPDVLVCDAETDDDLLAIAAASMQLDLQANLGGFGWTRLPIAARGWTRQDHSCRSTISFLRSVDRCLFVIGSLSRNSLEQVRRSVVNVRHTCQSAYRLKFCLQESSHAEWLIYAQELEARDPIETGCGAQPEDRAAHRSLATTHWLPLRLHAWLRLSPATSAH